MKDVIKDGTTSLLVPIRSPDAIVAAVERVLGGERCAPIWAAPPKPKRSAPTPGPKWPNPSPKPAVPFSSLGHFLLYRMGLAFPETQTSAAEQQALARLAEDRRRCVEIGVWHGVNTLRIRRVMAYDGVLAAVDPFPPGRLGFSIPERIARREVSQSTNGTVRWLKMTGAEAAKAWTEPVDFLFIDGDHSYEALEADWTGWSPKVAPGGLVCLHDSRSSAARKIDDAGSVKYTARHIVTDPRFEVVETVDTLTALRRK